MEKLLSLKDEWADFVAEDGYTCDLCGKEIFSYQDSRFCGDCQREFKPVGKLSCPVCGRKTIAFGVCLTCKQNRPIFDRGVTAYPFEGAAARAVNLLKNGKRYLCKQLAKALYLRALETGALTGLTPENTLVVCVPLGDKKLAQRGYNQAEALSKEFAVLARLPMEKNALKKTREVAEQKHSDAAKRQENAFGAYRVSKRKAVRGKTVLLIDDIMTTGATGSACARALKMAGAKRVLFLTLAATNER